MSHDCKAWPGTCGTLGCENAWVPAHPTHVVCPCNDGSGGRCPYLFPDIASPRIAVIANSTSFTCSHGVSLFEACAPCGRGGLTWYPPTPTRTTTLTPARAPWECPRCRRVNAPHADQCTCAGSP